MIIMLYNGSLNDPLVLMLTLANLLACSSEINGHLVQRIVSEDLKLIDHGDHPFGSPQLTYSLFGLLLADGPLPPGWKRNPDAEG